MGQIDLGDQQDQLRSPGRKVARAGLGWICAGDGTGVGSRRTARARLPWLSISSLGVPVNKGAKGESSNSHHSLLSTRKKVDGSALLFSAVMAGGPSQGKNQFSPASVGPARPDRVTRGESSFSGSSGQYCCKHVNAWLEPLNRQRRLGLWGRSSKLTGSHTS